MKKIIRKLISQYNNHRFSKKVRVGKRALFGRTSDIQLQDGSRKNDVFIGDDVMMLGRVISQNGGKITLSDKVNIRGETIIGAVNCISIGAGTIISNNVTIMDNNNHPISLSARKKMVAEGWGGGGWLWKHSESKPIKIGENVWIGQFARINKGVVIGDNSIVGANTVVTKDIPANNIVVGNPGKIVREVKR
ncbi:hypothetical protein A9Q88_00775 [Gammaproteobacteria bacterium 50_400_T64]|nr:hypothetical protein A9Q88_00775 [Gammaproteobacteria bacterium 50_400_T64]